MITALQLQKIETLSKRLGQKPQYPQGYEAAGKLIQRLESRLKQQEQQRRIKAQLKKDPLIK